jgi:K+-transporting ATPase c subunit
MKADKRDKESVTKPLLEDLVKRQKTDSKIENPTVGSTPLPPPDLYQDSGGGYNPDFTFPQE